MPHRYEQAKTTMIHTGEFLVLASSAIVASVNSLIDEQSWDRLTGRHGALFFMAIALIIFWNSNRVRTKREIERMAANETKEDARRKEEEILRQVENEAREHRHQEAMKLQRDNAQQLLALTVESVKSNAIVAKAQTEVAHALESLKDEIRKCPKLPPMP
jgi:hypothetical protein